MKKLTITVAVIAAFASVQYSSAQCAAQFGLVINEVMASNNAAAADEFGEYDDWVEIYNGTGEAINIGGYFLSDSRGNRTKYTFPDHVMQPEDYVIVWCDNQPEQGPWHAPFGLSADGEHIALYDPDTVSVDYMRFGPIPTNISRGRFPNGTGPFHILIPTFNGPNTNSVDVGVVINEYQSINESTAQDQWGAFDDWIEIYNNSSQPIDLTGYFLSDKIGTPEQFQFPDTVIPPHGYMIVWCDQGFLEPGLHAPFKLGGDGDDILFSDPDTLTIDYVRFGIITPDETEGRFPNGTGPFTCLQPTFSESNGEPVGVFDAVAFRPLRFYPNPARTEVWVVNDRDDEVDFQVIDPAGRVVLSQALSGIESRVDISHLHSGVYIVVSGDRRGKLVVN